MTTESVITSGQIDADSPYDVTLASAMAYNWIAGFEGNSTNKIATAAYGDDSISVAKIDFTNFDGPVHNWQSYQTALTGVTVAWVTSAIFYIYIPTNVAQLNYGAIIYSSSGTYTAYARLTCASASGTQLSTSSTSPLWVSGGTLDVSAESGWTFINIQQYISNAAGTAYLTLTSNYWT